MLKLSFSLDANDGGYETGKAMLVLNEGEHVRDVGIVSLHMVAEGLAIWEEKHGAFTIEQTDAHELSPAEWVQLELQNKWADVESQRNAERLALELERKKEMATKMYDVMFSGWFETWYEKDFMDHVEGEEDCKSKDDIIAELAKQI